MAGHFLHLFKSTVRIATDAIAELTSSGLASPSYLNMDAMAQIAEWPNNDLLGTAQFSMRLDEHLIDITCLFGVSPYEDEQLLRHVTMLDLLVDRLKPTMTHPVYHAASGEKLGWMRVANGTTVHGIERTESRPLQFIGVSFVTSLTYKLQQNS